MSAVLEQTSYHADTQTTPPVVVIGTGPVGIRFVEEVLLRSPHTSLVIYGDEPWEPYNRVRLASLLSGELNFADIQNPLKLMTHHRVVQHHNCQIVAIDRDNKKVYDRLGNCQSYSRLVLATGSSPHIPNIEGIQRSGIYTFRNLDDAQQLIARRTRSRRAVVLGGGLLGLEAARGLQKFNTQVTVIEHANRLMAQQLDDEASGLLHEHILSQGIQIVLGDSVKRVLGGVDISGIELLSGRRIDCDTLVIAAGIRPNLTLARGAGISVGRGIRVNDRMQTSDADIFAVGECAEHRDRIYGLVAPGLEQASVAAHTITGGTSRYVGSQVATRLKVVGVSVISAGRSAEQEVSSQLRQLTWRSGDKSRYRKLLLQRNRLRGVIAYGDWDESSRAQEAVQHGRFLSPWQRARFLRTGKLWPEQDAVNVNDWPARAVVCQCTGVNRGTLSRAIRAGHCTVEALCRQTGASSVCGNCKPLVAELVGSQAIEPELGSHTLLWSGIAALLTALVFLFAPPLPFADSVQIPLRWDQLWRDGLIKQTSGYSLLAIGLLASLISLRKRVTRVSLGTFAHWRVIHTLLSLLAVAALVAHTGLRLGHELNLYLMLSFTGLLVAGAVASGVIGLQHLLPRGLAKRARELSLWMHILLLWPLPALLGFHIFKTYWF